MPWLHHLTLAVGILTSHAKLDRQTIKERLYKLHACFRVLFPRYHISSFDEWKPIEHLPQYLNDLELPDSLAKRQDFLRTYVAVAHHTATYLRALPEVERQVYQRWMLPPLPADLHHSLSLRGIWLAEQRQRRKEETDALAPHFARIRGESHLRWNQLQKLRDKLRWE